MPCRNDSHSDPKTIVEELQKSGIQISKALHTGLSLLSTSKNIDVTSLDNAVEKEFAKLNRMIEGAKLLDHCPEQTAAQILSLGERLSILYLSWVFTSLGSKVSQIDPEKFLVAENQ